MYTLKETHTKEYSKLLLLEKVHVSGVVRNANVL